MGVEYDEKKATKDGFVWKTLHASMGTMNIYGNYYIETVYMVFTVIAYYFTFVKTQSSPNEYEHTHTKRDAWTCHCRVSLF